MVGAAAMTENGVSSHVFWLAALLFALRVVLLTGCAREPLTAPRCRWRVDTLGDSLTRVIVRQQQPTPMGVRCDP